MISKTFWKSKKFMQPIRRLSMHSGEPNIFILGYFWGRWGKEGENLLGR
jgi:hypothetical protein